MKGPSQMAYDPYSAHLGGEKTGKSIRRAKWQAIKIIANFEI